jgi:hypothetical protein
MIKQFDLRKSGWHSTYQRYGRHSVTATLKLFQERGETFRDGLGGGIVPGPEPLPDFPQPWASGQDVAMLGLTRPTLPALATAD